MTDTWGGVGRGAFEVLEGEPVAVDVDGVHEGGKIGRPPVRVTRYWSWSPLSLGSVRWS